MLPVKIVKNAAIQERRGIPVVDQTSFDVHKFSVYDGI